MNKLRKSILIKASICVVTYNQEKHIRRCLESILNQLTSFNFELIVGDDCSTDNTKVIISELHNKYPEILKPIFHSTNIGVVKNYISVHKKAVGDYVFHVDGDDFCCQEKLEKQFHFMEKNKDCIAVFHKLLNVDKDGNSLSSYWPTNFSYYKYNLSQLAATHPEFGHSSLCYRNGAIDSIIYSGLDDFIDFEIYIHLASKGSIGIIDEKLGEYTCGIGVSALNNLYKLVIQALIKAKDFGLSPDEFKYCAARQYSFFANKALIENNLTLFKCLIELSIKEKIISFKQLILFWLRNMNSILKFIVKIYLRNK